MAGSFDRWEKVLAEGGCFDDGESVAVKLYFDL